MGFAYTTETQGGWDAVANILNSIGKGADYTASSFFPTPQYNTIKSATVEAARADGQPNRVTLPENQSMIETNWWSALGWVNSPYEDSNAIPVKVDESKGLDQSVSGTTAKKIEEGLEWAIDTAKKGSTLYEQIKGIFSDRDVVEGTPRAGFPEGRDEQHTNIEVNRGAAMTQSTAKDFFEQVKGLFGLGYPQSQPQPSVPVRHEAAVNGVSLTMPMLIGGAVILYFLLN